MLRDCGASEHRFDAVHRFRSARVDGHDAPMGDVGALERDVLHADDFHVVNKGAAPWIRRGSSRRLTRSPTSFGKTGVEAMAYPLFAAC
jgi:hypothetical protein